jgi:hypothetical protein
LHRDTTALHRDTTALHRDTTALHRDTTDGTATAERTVTATADRTAPTATHRGISVFGGWVRLRRDRAGVVTNHEAGGTSFARSRRFYLDRDIDSVAAGYGRPFVARF